MHNIIQYFPLNTRGRDFIIGDVHGAFDLVIEAMRRVRFDNAVDRLFSVGDLIDRGPESARALRFLRQPYVHAILGNHEKNLLDLYSDGNFPEGALEWYANRFGAQWWLKLDATQRHALLDAFSRLPVVMEIETTRGTVGVVHGDVPAGMDWPTFKARVAAGDEATLQTALEGRRRILSASEHGVKGIGRVYVGHTPQWSGARRFGNVYAIDTGAIFSQIMDDHDGHLTFSPLTCKTEVIVPGMRDIRDGVDVVPEPNARDASRPFGLHVICE